MLDNDIARTNCVKFIIGGANDGLQCQCNLCRLCSLQKEFKPVRYFSMDRVFRNETLDATHLAEFHQIEGVIANRGLTLGDLMGVIHEFFTKLGLLYIYYKK